MKPRKRKMVHVVDLGSGASSQRLTALAVKHRRKKFEAVGPKLVKGFFKNLRMIREDALLNLRKRPDASVKIINMDHSIHLVGFQKLLSEFDEKKRIQFVQDLYRKGLFIPKQFLEEVRRVLVPNGRFYITIIKPAPELPFLQQLKEFFGEENVYARAPRLEELKAPGSLQRMQMGIPLLRIVCANRKETKK